MESTTVSLRTPTSLVAMLDEEAARLRRSRNSIVNELIEKHFANGHQEPSPTLKKLADARKKTEKSIDELGRLARKIATRKATR